LPPPAPPLTVGLDGGYVHAKDQKSRTEGWFEVIAGKSVDADGGAKCFAFVNKYDQKPKRRCATSDLWRERKRRRFPRLAVVPGAASVPNHAGILR